MDRSQSTDTPIFGLIQGDLHLGAKAVMKNGQTSPELGQWNVQISDDDDDLRFNSRYSLAPDRLLTPVYSSVC